MSLTISVVCEDHTHDQYVVKPVIEKLMASLGKPKARVHVVTKPHLTGISVLRKKACDILEQYGLISDLVVFVIDNDGAPQDGPSSRKSTFQHHLESCSASGEKAVVVSAIQESEVWALWGSRGSLKDSWATVRAERDPKEVYFKGLQTKADLQSPGEGRSRLVALSLALGWTSLAAGCPELVDLATEIKTKLSL